MDLLYRTEDSQLSRVEYLVNIPEVAEGPLVLTLTTLLLCWTDN